MNSKDAKQFIKHINDAYPTFEPTPGRVKLWVEYLEDVPFEKAMERLKNHISKSKFAPSISEILNAEKEKFLDYNGNPF